MKANPVSKDISAFQAIAFAGFVAGTLDILAAILLTVLRGGEPLKMFQFIASGLFGSAAFAGGWVHGIYGLIFHYCIAMIWAIIFFATVRKFFILRRHALLTGILFGVVVWLIMNLVILPLSATPPLPFKLESAIIGALVLVLAIGLPFSYLFRRYFARRNDPTPGL